MMVSSANKPIDSFEKPVLVPASVSAVAMDEFLRKFLLEIISYRIV
jgi:hypothetical protein